TPAIDPERLLSRAPEDDLGLAEYSSRALADGKGGEVEIQRASGSECRGREGARDLDRRVAVRYVDRREGRLDAVERTDVDRLAIIEDQPFVRPQPERGA